MLERVGNKKLQRQILSVRALRTLSALVQTLSATNQMHGRLPTRPLTAHGPHTALATAPLLPAEELAAQMLRSLQHTARPQHR